LARLKAESAEAQGDYASAMKHREVAAEELEIQRTATKELVNRKIVPRSELRLLDAAVAEAKIEVLQVGIRRHLADIVAVREQELKEAKILFGSKVISAEELRKFERALEEARARLSVGR
jgi:hypothetical protein